MLGPFFSSRTSRERAVTPRMSSVSRRGVQYSCAALIGQAGLDQPVGDHLLQIARRLALHAGGNFFGAKFEQKIRHQRLLRSHADFPSVARPRACGAAVARRGRDLFGTKFKKQIRLICSARMLLPDASARSSRHATCIQSRVQICSRAIITSSRLRRCGRAQRSSAANQKQIHWLLPCPHLDGEESRECAGACFGSRPQ